MAAGTLLVEGTDDLHVVSSLLKRHSFPEVFAIKEKGGIDEVLRVLPVQLKGSAVSAVGVMIDADQNLGARWQSVRKIAESAGFAAVPDNPPADGLVLVQASLPRFGAWLMPDNQIIGMLEDFVAKLIPENDTLWAHASATVEALGTNAKFKSQHKCKAQIHTWLAWQEDPGTPMGLSITKKYLDAGSPNCGDFLLWLRRLFVD